MNNQELLQQRRIVGWFGADVDGLDDEKVQVVFSDIREKLHALIVEEREEELAPQRASEKEYVTRIQRILRVMAGESIRDVARDEGVITVTVSDAVRYSMGRLASVEVSPSSREIAAYELDELDYRIS